MHSRIARINGNLYTAAVVTNDNRFVKILETVRGDDVFVVQSAASAFNNMALFSPAFLWSALLSLPLFFMVWMCGNLFMAKIGWDKQNLIANSSVWVAGLTFVWVVLFSGSYNVLRDSLSVLPLMIALIIFLTSLFVSSHLRDKKLEKFGWRQFFILFAVLIEAIRMRRIVPH